MQKSLISQVQLGRQYAKEWPMRKELTLLFPEFRVIKATEFALQVMPALAIISVFVQTSYLGMAYLPQAITIALFFLSLPVQGLLWLGKRADTRLNPALNSWYKELHHKMVANGYQADAARDPKYRELAKLLNDMFEKMDKAFAKENL
ncbi:terminus macrodomain insulation protein YfbV [Pseudoalteromonas ardens]|nr:terminus macrodomain insulation protein YfbV [Pseudoalteromonas sp. R96]MDK1311192.1 terminus macrodomain insulation protein YfbV [Pseudoalteromonas sp. R96]